MKILLTGANGFLGRALARHWREAGHALQLVGGRKDFPAALARANTEPVDWVVHAGFSVEFRRDPAALAANLASAEAVAELFARGRAGRLLFLSAAGVMGVGKMPVERDESKIGRTDEGFEAYSATSYIQGKLACEQLFRAKGIPLTVAYPTTVFGPGMPAATLAALEKRLALVPPGGTSFLGLPCFLRAMDSLLARDATGEGFILNGENLAYQELFETAARERGAPARLVTLPSFARTAARAAGAVSGGFLSSAVIESAFGFKYYSAEKMRAGLSWEPNPDFAAAYRAALGH